MKRAMTDEQFEGAKEQGLARLDRALGELLAEREKSLQAEVACVERKARAASKAPGVVVESPYIDERVSQ